VTKKLDRSRPPTDCKEKFLFRSLLRRPRPQQALNFRVRGAEHIKLYARALKSLEQAEAFEAGDDIELEQLTVSAITAELISLTVYTPRGRAFGSSDDVMRLSGNEIGQLGSEVLNVLHAISPTYSRSDTGAWEMALKKGAQDLSNIHEAMSMYRSCDRVGMDGTVYERPDRYFGLPICELTDGQLMVFSAATKYVADAIRSPDG